LLSLLTAPSMPAKLPLRDMSRFGLNRSTPMSNRLPAQTMLAGLLAPPNESTAIAVEAPPMPLAFMP